MKRLILLAGGLVAAWGGVCAADYPEARRSDFSEELHGERVADPYRWMEDIDSDETVAWVKAQAEFADEWMAGVPERAGIRERLEELWNYERVSAPTVKGGRVFYSRNSGLQNQSVLYWHPEGEAGKAAVLLDPNTLSEDGTVALSRTSVSDDGKYLAYGTSASGSDWQEWRVREVATGKDLEDHVKWVKFSSAEWAPDGSGFLYSRYDAPKEGEELKGANYFQKVYFHKLGTAQSEDRLIYERKDEKEWGFGAGFSEDGEYLVMEVWKGSAGENGMFYRKAEGGEWVELFVEFDAHYSFLGNDGAVFYVETDKEAPNGRIVAVDLAKPEAANWRTVVAESKDKLQGASLFGDEVVVSYLEDAKSRVSVYGLADGAKVRDVALPGLGSVSGFGGKRDAKETYYTFSSFTVPGSIYRYEVGSGKSEVFREPEVKFDPNAYEVKQVFFESKDGTKVPMFICHKKGLEYDGTAPVYQYGYGGFNISITPRFSVQNVVWMEMGGVYAQVTLRGGGEYGEEWHQAGMKGNKQNVFDDFIGASEWLIENKVTSKEKLAIAGGSNGGLLVGACITQRPELYGGAYAAVGVMDMLRFQKFTIGWAWQDEYGFPDEKEDFEVLRKYSPLHNVKPGTCYPPTMVATGDHDDRVFPAHSFKFAAELQAGQGCENPILLRVDRKAGHGAGKPTSKRIDEAADRWAFLLRVLGESGK